MHLLRTHIQTCIHFIFSFGAIESVKTHACARVEFVKQVKTISHSEGDRRPESQHSNPSASHQDRACGRAFQISGQSTSTYLESAAITQSASTRQTSSAQVQSPRAKRRGMLVGSERERSTGGGLWSDSESGSPKAAKLNLAGEVHTGSISGRRLGAFFPSGKISAEICGSSKINMFSAISWCH